MTDIFNYKSFTFPKDFLWGSSTAAYQIEGDNIYSDWWEMEQKKIRDKVPGWDFSGKACNSYELFEEDVTFSSEVLECVSFFSASEPLSSACLF